MKKPSRDGSDQPDPARQRAARGWAGSHGGPCALRGVHLGKKLIVAPSLFVQNVIDGLRSWASLTHSSPRLHDGLRNGAPGGQLCPTATFDGGAFTRLTSYAPGSACHDCRPKALMSGLLQASRWWQGSATVILMSMSSASHAVTIERVAVQAPARRAAHRCPHHGPIGVSSSQSFRSPTFRDLLFDTRVHRIQGPFPVVAGSFRTASTRSSRGRSGSERRDRSNIVLIIMAVIRPGTAAVHRAAHEDGRRHARDVLR